MAEEDSTPPQQAPTLTDLEEARADAETARRLTVEWLMSSEEAPDFEVVLAELVSRPAWHRQAACKGVGPEVFFPERGQSSEGAKAVCGGCEVRQQCLADALANGDRHGIWGGMSERGRRVLRRAAA